MILIVGDLQVQKEVIQIEDRHHEAGEVQGVQEGHHREDPHPEDHHQEDGTIQDGEVHKEEGVHRGDRLNVDGIVPDVEVHREDIPVQDVVEVALHEGHLPEDLQTQTENVLVPLMIAVMKKVIPLVFIPLSPPSYPIL